MSGFLSRLLFPAACPLCGTLASPELVEVQGCCQRCWEDCVYPPEQALLFSPAFAPFCSEILCGCYYDGPVKEAVTKYKFSEATYMGPCFGRLLYTLLSQCEVLENLDLIVAVPISPQRFRERGYNQSLLVAQEISKRSGLPVAELLERKQQGMPQSSLLAEERRRDIADKFTIKQATENEAKGKAVLLIDDILTTGSTMNRCAQLLSEAGAKWITGACIAGGRQEFM